MKRFQLIILLLFLQCLVFAQSDDQSNTDVEISSFKPEDILNRPSGVECGFGSGLCGGSFMVISIEEERSSTYSYGKFSINPNDSLRLSIEKNTIPLDQILALFGDNKFDVETQFHVPLQITINLGIDPIVVKSGSYNVFDSSDNENLVIGFGPVSYLPVSKNENFEKDTNKEGIIDNNRMLNDRE